MIQGADNLKDLLSIINASKYKLGDSIKIKRESTDKSSIDGSSYYPFFMDKFYLLYPLIDRANGGQNGEVFVEKYAEFVSVKAFENDETNLTRPENTDTLLYLLSQIIYRKNMIRDQFGKEPGVYDLQGKLIDFSNLTGVHFDYVVEKTYANEQEVLREAKEKGIDCFKKYNDSVTVNKETMEQMKQEAEEGGFVILDGLTKKESLQ